MLLCKLQTLYCDILISSYFHYNPILIFNIHVNFESYIIESELYKCIHDCMKTFYKDENVTCIHLLDLQLLQDKN